MNTKKWIQKIWIKYHLLEWSESQCSLYTWSVGKECSKTSLKEQAKIQHPICHSLVEDRQSSCLADDQISPLYDDNCDKKCSVAGQLKLFALVVGLEREETKEMFMSCWWNEQWKEKWKLKFKNRNTDQKGIYGLKSSNQKSDIYCSLLTLLVVISYIYTYIHIIQYIGIQKCKHTHSEP